MRPISWTYCSLKITFFPLMKIDSYVFFPIIQTKKKRKVNELGIITISCCPSHTNKCYF